MRKLTLEERKIVRSECLKLIKNVRAVTAKDVNSIDRCIDSLTPSFDDCFERFEENCTKLFAMKLGDEANEAIFKIICNVFMITAIITALLNIDVDLVQEESSNVESRED